MRIFTNTGSWGDISLIVRRQTGTGERENGQIVRCPAARGDRFSYPSDVPAIAEVLPGYEAMAWVGIFAAANTPLEVVRKIQTEVRGVVHAAEVAQRLRELGASPIGNTPEEFTGFIKRDTEKWRALVRTANIKVE